MEDLVCTNSSLSACNVLDATQRKMEDEQTMQHLLNIHRGPASTHIKWEETENVSQQNIRENLLPKMHR